MTLVRVEPNPQGRIQVLVGCSPAFECSPCDELLLWDASHKTWMCPICQFELSISGAALVVATAQKELDALASALLIPKRKQWPWWTWLRRLLRLQEA